MMSRRMMQKDDKDTSQFSIQDRCGEIWNFSTCRGISDFPHNRCGEMWNFAKFGEISHFSTGQMWRNLKFIQFFVIKSVLRCFCEIRFGAIYALLRGENFCKKLGRWRKNDKYQVCSQEILKMLKRQLSGTIELEIGSSATNTSTANCNLWKRTISTISKTSIMLKIFGRDDNLDNINKVNNLDIFDNPENLKNLWKRKISTSPTPRIAWS